MGSRHVASMFPILPNLRSPVEGGGGLSQPDSWLGQAHSGHQAGSSLPMLRPLAFGPAGACTRPEARSHQRRRESRGPVEIEGIALSKRMGVRLWPISCQPLPASPFWWTAAALWDHRKGVWGAQEARLPTFQAGPDRLDPHAGRGRQVHQAGRQVSQQARRTFSGALGHRTVSSSVSRSRPNVPQLWPGRPMRLRYGFESHPHALC